MKEDLLSFHLDPHKHKQEGEFHICSGLRGISIGIIRRVPLLTIPCYHGYRIIIPDSFGDDRRCYISVMSTSAEQESQIERHMSRDICVYAN